jgi:hypothetical protein
MKRLVLSLMMAGGLALMAAPKASAGIFGGCGKTYAVLLQGAQETTTDNGQATGTVGVGSITFGAAGTAGTDGCTITSGELIYNSGDIQTSPVGISFGPSECFDAASGFGTGIPCFNGGSASAADGGLTAGAAVPSGAPYPPGSFTVAFTANYNWFDASDGNDTESAIPFGFIVIPSLADFVIVGNSVPAPGGPVLSITMEKQYTVPVPNTYGTAPYLGLSTLECTGYGANTTDLVAAGQSSGGSDGYGATTGALQIFSNGAAGGNLSFNADDNFGVTTTPSNDDECDFASSPDSSAPSIGPAYGLTPDPNGSGSEFGDGANNNVAFVTGGTSCAAHLVAGSGYFTSGVQWGAGDDYGYLTVTGLFSNATGAVPPGEMATCTEYENVPAGTITNLVEPQTITSINKLVLGYVKVTNGSPAACDIDATMPTEIAEGCTLSLTDVGSGNPGETDPVLVEGNEPSTQYFTTNCTCSGTSGDSVTSTLSLSSPNGCPLSGTTSYTITCKN